MGEVRTILAIESSATACSVALCRGSKLIAQSFQNNGLTHSKTLLPMITTLLEQCEISLSSVDLIGVAVGPGSFTGLRIGVSTAKGLAWANEIACAPCSTLEAMAWQLSHLEGYTVICVMDARRKQVYHSRFFIKNGIPCRLCPDGGVDLEDLKVALDAIETPKILVGDGTELCAALLENVQLPPAHLQMQQAWGVAQVARLLDEAGKLVSSGDLVPEYHRLSQAERERLERGS